MRVFAVSDLHLDFAANCRWLDDLPQYPQDVLILAGDVSDSLQVLEWCFDRLSRRFLKVLFTPGNHDLWVVRDDTMPDSYAKFRALRALGERLGIAFSPFHCSGLSILPLHAWYDFSFGLPSARLRELWADFHACRWPAGHDPVRITESFLNLNEPVLNTSNRHVISFSHFLPRADLLAPGRHAQALLPVMGSTRLEAQVRRLRPQLHIYGHSHAAADAMHDGIRYLNHALGYPREYGATQPHLRCVFEFDPAQPF
jgi:predicted phosphodiesterase